MENANEDIARGPVLTQKVKVAIVAHFVNAVTIEHLKLSPQQKELVTLVDHVYWLYKRNPFLDIHALFYELLKERYKSQAYPAAYAAHMSRMLERMFEYAVDNTKPPSRKRDEEKVRFVADRLMERGLATDNDRAMGKGADLLTKVARLDQPETERADMSKVTFLPSVVVTNIQEVDDTKVNYDDEQSRDIMRKYQAHVDEKRILIDDKVALLEASSSSSVLNNQE